MTNNPRSTSQWKRKFPKRVIAHRTRDRNDQGEGETATRRNPGIRRECPTSWMTYGGLECSRNTGCRSPSVRDCWRRRRVACRADYRRRCPYWASSTSRPSPPSLSLRAPGSSSHTSFTTPYVCAYVACLDRNILFFRRSQRLANAGVMELMAYLVVDVRARSEWRTSVRMTRTT